MTRMDRAEAHLDEITAGAVRAVARTLDSAGTLNDLIREAAERAVRAHLQGAAQAALVDALEGDFGKAPEEQVEQALTERCLRARAEAAQPWHVRGFLSFRSGIVVRDDGRHDRLRCVHGRPPLVNHLDRNSHCGCRRVLLPRRPQHQGV